MFFWDTSSPSEFVHTLCSLVKECVSGLQMKIECKGLKIGMSSNLIELCNTSVCEAL